MGNLSESSNIHNRQQGIGGCLRPDDACGTRSDCRAYGVEIGEIHRRVLQPPRGGDAGKEPVGASVGVIADHGVVTGLCHRTQKGVLGRKTRGKGQPPTADLEGCQALLQRMTSGVAAAGILIAVP